MVYRGAPGRSAGRVLVDMDSKEGRQVWDNLDFGGTPRIALSRDHVLAAEWTLLKPIRAGGPLSLTEVLTSVAGKLQLSAPAPSAPTSKWRPFAALVRKACHKSYPADVVLPTGSALVVDPHGKVFYSSRTTDELAALLRNRRRLDGKVVAVPDTRKFAARLARWGIMPRPLEELLWLTVWSPVPGNPSAPGTRASPSGSAGGRTSPRFPTGNGT